MTSGIRNQSIYLPPPTLRRPARIRSGKIRRENDCPGSNPVTRRDYRIYCEKLLDRIFGTSQRAEHRTLFTGDRLNVGPGHSDVNHRMNGY